MCLEENYSNSPNNEYSRHYSAEKKKGHHIRKSPHFDPNLDKKQKKSQNDNGLILGRVSINTRTPLGTSLLGPTGIPCTNIVVTHLIHSNNVGYC